MSRNTPVTYEAAREVERVRQADLKAERSKEPEPEVVLRTPEQKAAIQDHYRRHGITKASICE